MLNRPTFGGHIKRLSFFRFRPNRGAKQGVFAPSLAKTGNQGAQRGVFAPRSFVLRFIIGLYLLYLIFVSPF